MSILDFKFDPYKLEGGELEKFFKLLQDIAGHGSHETLKAVRNKDRSFKEYVITLERGRLNIYANFNHLGLNKEDWFKELDLPEPVFSTTDNKGREKYSLIFPNGDVYSTKKENPVSKTIPRQAGEIGTVAMKHLVDRSITYDQPDGERSAAKTAKIFNTYRGTDLKASDIFFIMQILKDVRQYSRENYHQDSAEDAIAYAALKAEELEREQAEKEQQEKQA
jgi:hypothetical protein